LNDVAFFGTPRSIDQISDPDQGIFNRKEAQKAQKLEQKVTEDTENFCFS